VSQNGSALPEVRSGGEVVWVGLHIPFIPAVKYGIHIFSCILKDYRHL